jgi:hypothetical protein
LQREWRGLFVGAGFYPARGQGRASSRQLDWLLPTASPAASCPSAAETHGRARRDPRPSA